jgi:hypothetical protein
MIITYNAGLPVLVCHPYRCEVGFFSVPVDTTVRCGSHMNRTVCVCGGLFRDVTYPAVG